MAESAATRDEKPSRREVILDATLRVIGAGGVDSVTHRRVAAEARVPLGSIAYYFQSRDELIPAAFRQHMSEVRHTVHFVEERVRPLTTAKLVAALVELSQHYLARPGIQRAEFEMYVYAARHPSVAEEVERWQTELAAQLAPELEELGFDRPIEAARCLMGVVRGFELEWLIRPDASLEELRRRLDVTVVGLLGSRRQTSRRPAARGRGRSRG